MSINTPLLTLKVLLFCLILSCNANAQYLGTYMNGLSVPGLRLRQVDDAVSSDKQNLMKSKVKSVQLYNEKDKLIKEAQYDSHGRVIQILEYYAYSDSLYKKSTYEYNAEGLLAAYKYTLYDNTNFLPPNTTASYYEYNNGLELRIKEDTLKRDYGIHEAVYEGSRLVAVKVYGKDMNARTTVYPITYSQNSIAFSDTSGGGKFNFFHITEVKDTVKIISDLMTNEETIYFNGGKIIYEGTTNNYYRKYFYKDNGLIDYTLEADNIIPERKLYYRYEYFVE